jgi:oxygen-independent coproporphyrinogen-3 oxidase
MLEDCKGSLEEEDFLKEYMEVKKFLENKWFNRYELSNFAKASFECKHNLGYWQHKDCLAFGLSAHWFLNNVRFANSNKIEDYYAWKWRIKEILTEEEIFLEKMMFALRCNWISREDSGKLNKKKVEEFIEDWYLIEIWDKICLSDGGVGVLDYILKEII